MSTERRTWPRSAPRARSRPSSRVRCAISMEKVLTIRKMPTSTATPAKPSITYLTTSRKPPSSDAAESACSSAVSSSRPEPTAAAMRRLSVASLTPSQAVAQMLVASSAEPSSSRWALLVSRKTRAAPGLVVVKVAMPTISTLTEPGRARTVRVSPISTFFVGRVASRTACRGPRGACPEVSRTGERSVTYQLVATVGAPVVEPTDSLSRPTTVTLSTETSRCASATPSTSATRSRRLAGTVGVRPEGTASSRSSGGLIMTSADVEANSRSKVRLAVWELRAAGHERHRENDGERGAPPALVREEAPERRLQHGGPRFSSARWCRRG
ncbi:hypothetical protein SALBM135S_06398 [Streptomyces alboniger]